MLTTQQTLKIARAVSMARVGDVFATAERSFIARAIRLAQSIKRRRKIRTSHNAAIYRSVGGEAMVMDCHIPTCKAVTLVAFLSDLEERKVPWSLLRLKWRNEEKNREAWEKQFSRKLSTYAGMDYPERDLWEQFIIGILPFMSRIYSNNAVRAYCTDSWVKTLYSVSHLHLVPPIFSAKYTSPALVERALREGVLVKVIDSTTTRG